MLVNEIKYLLAVFSLSWNACTEKIPREEKKLDILPPPQISFRNRTASLTWFYIRNSLLGSGIDIQRLKEDVSTDFSIFRTF